MKIFLLGFFGFLNFRSKYIYISFLAICLLWPYRVSSQWIKSDGPYGGAIRSFGFQGTNIFAATIYGGVYTSSNNGTSWIARNSDITNLNMTSIATTTNYIFAGSSDGLFRSGNSGASWTALNFEFGYVRTATVSGNRLLVGSSRGLFYSEDEGASWTKSIQGSSSLPTYTFAKSGSNLLAGGEDGVYLSTDDGSSWTLMDSTPGILSMAASDNNVFAATGNGKMIRSTTSGATWTAVSHDFVISVNAIAAIDSAIFAGTAGGGIFLSTDNGLTWTGTNSGLSYYDVTALAVHGTDLFLGNGGAGAYLSKDYGASWSPINNGLSNAFITALTKQGTNLFAGTWGAGVFWSANNGTSWVNSTQVALTTTSFAESPNYLFASGNGVLRSSNQGASWSSANNNISSQTVSCLARMGNLLFAGTRDGGINVSANDGDHWTTANAGLTVSNINCMLVSGSNLFAGTAAKGVFVSSDQGASWNSFNNNLMNTEIFSLVSSGNKVFAATGLGVYVSSDNGASWSPINKGLANAFISTLAVDSEKIYAGSSNGVYVSNLNNIYWFHEGLAGMTINYLLANDGEIIAGTQAGLFTRTIPPIPEIIDVTPSGAMVGSTVIITTANFDESSLSDTVKFNGVQAEITNVTPTAITVTVPVGATTGTLAITIDGQTFITSTEFIVYALPAPVATEATAVTSTGFTANWNPVEGALGYQLDVSKDNFATLVPGFQEVVVFGTDKIVPGIEAGITYQYKVSAFNSAGTSAPSNIVSIVLNKLDQTITFESLDSVNYGTTPFALSATSTSGLSVSYLSSNTAVATVNGNMVTVIGGGATIITASQSGNDSYSPAANVEQSLFVSTRTMSISGLEIIQDTLRFNNVTLDSSATRSFTITNTGTSTLHIFDINYPDGFTGSASNATILSNGTLNIDVAFSPSTTTRIVDQISFTSDATAGPDKINVSGTVLTITGVMETTPPLSLYPNPGSGEFFIEGIVVRSENPRVQIINTLGQSKGSFTLHKTNASRYLLDITSLDGGMYVILIDNHRAVKVIKK